MRQTAIDVIRERAVAYRRANKLFPLANVNINLPPGMFTRSEFERMCTELAAERITLNPETVVIEGS